MPRFYVAQTFAEGGVLRLPENVCRHIQVLRLQAGAPLVLFDGRGGAAQAVLLEIGRRQALARVDKLLTESRESPLAVTLLQAVSASEKMDFAVQKSTELGVGRIVPVVAARSNVRLQGERAEKKVRRWQDIAISACEQCGRNQVPQVAPIADLAQALAALPAEAGARLLLSPHDGVPLRSLPKVQNAVLLIGPEGGLTAKEEALARSHGFQPVRLGARVLRTETAALAALAAMQALWGDF
ncbi:16S rRNA (uracil(1498)-N(3))-methyltransferase [Eikenella sp. S3360]|uniref:Ribosomal RNA small subunit methyltransferase E n=1 Tax=Eikenella glucosivorans TaxID=2766967 RepID=A0ABS0NCQ0_9NEIS|nr:16S rRNA (uracil(1498)-N(3))-methyltransferase [Eikenella glucosivorans]MBH5330088.1 16S rRNA (uracil(1498)-N(3))-methyltransferase [Eikenella glucosivorans]